jgi:serine/threonine-protein kinase/endoribonuclease IRE1
LNQLHSLGIVHGNLKPSNILISFPKGDGTGPMMKLADFGIRRAVRTGGVTQFRLVTTEGWMCPTDPQDLIGPSFDTFSLGCIYGFIVLNGLHPFGTDPISRIANRKPMTLTLSQVTARSLFKQSFYHLIARMLNYDASKRPSTNFILCHPLFNHPSAIIFPTRRLEQQQQNKRFLPLSTSDWVDKHQHLQNDK